MHRPSLIVCGLVWILTLPTYGVAGENDTDEELPKNEVSEPKSGLEKETKRKKTDEKIQDEKASDDKTAEANVEEKNTTEASADTAPAPSVSKSDRVTDSVPDTGNTGASDDKTISETLTEQAEASVKNTLNVTPQPASDVKAKLNPLPSNRNETRKTSPSTVQLHRKPRKMITAGIGVPLCGFAYEGIIEGKGCANTSSNFLWGNIDLRFHVRLSKRFSVGIGLLQTFIRFDDVGLMGGHVVADFRWYAVPDYLYFKMDLFFGFPMFFALGPTIGHSLPITEKVHLFIENQFLFMAVAGVYGFWQPTIGVSTRF